MSVTCLFGLRAGLAFGAKPFQFTWARQMKASINFETETPSSSTAKFEILVSDGSGPPKTYDSNGTTTEVDIERLPVKIEIREQFAGSSS